MADIKKTLSQLMIDYADNSAGSITPQLLRNGFKTVVGSMVISAVTSNYPLVEDDIFINALPASADITLTLPSASTFIEKYYIIKNSSPTYNVIVAGSIDSLTNYTVSAGQTLGIESNGTTWVSYIKPIDLSGFATTGSLSNYATSSSVSTLSADVQNKAYTSSVNTQVNNLSSIYAPIGSYITSAQVSATYETIADAANKMYTSAAFTKTSADTLYAPISTSAAIINLSATYATIASVSSISADLSNKAYTSDISATYETLTDASNKAYTSAISAALNAQDASTGIYFGGNVAKVDATHFSLSATKGWIIDSITNPDAPVYTFVTYPGSASILDQYVSVSGSSTYIYLTSAGTVGQQNSTLTPAQKRSNLYLGFSYHLSAGTIQNVVSQPDIKINEFSQVRDMFSALKYINKGVSVVANGANLYINLISGSLFGLGANWQNASNSPTKLDISGATSAIFQYRTQSDFGTPNISAVDGTNYDLAGIVTAIPASGPAGGPKDKAQATNQRVYIAPSGNLRIMYGQKIYASLAEAIAGITTESFILAPSITANLQLIGIISITKAASSLLNTGVDAQFTLPSMFGEVSVGAGGLATTNMQQAYLNSPIPQVKITSANGAMEYQGYDNSSLTFAVLNSAGFIVYGVSADGSTSATSAIANTFTESGTTLSAKYQGINTTLTKTSADTLYIPKTQNEITKDPTGFFNPEGVTVTYTTSSRTITLGGSVSAYWHGTLVPTLSSGWVSSPCPSGTSATQYLYYNGTSTIWSSTPWTLDMLQIALVGIDHADVVQFAERECHGMMNWESHKDFHTNIGTYITSTGGGDVTNITTASTTVSARQPYISALTLNDEDLVTINPALTTSAYTQYSLNTSAAWSIFTSGTDIIQLSGSQPQYNLNTAGVWSQALLPNNAYAAIFLASIPVSTDTVSQAKRYLFIQPQQQSGTLATIQALTPNNLSLGNLPSITPEIVFFGRIIIRYASGNWTIIQYDKIIGSKISQTTITGGSGLTTVTTDGVTISGAGTTGSPIGLLAQVTPGTYDMVVIDQYGRVTSGGPSSASGGGTSLISSTKQFYRQYGTNNGQAMNVSANSINCMQDYVGNASYTFGGGGSQNALNTYGAVWMVPHTITQVKVALWLSQLGNTTGSTLFASASTQFLAQLVEMTSAGNVINIIAAVPLNVSPITNIANNGYSNRSTEPIYSIGSLTGLSIPAGRLFGLNLYCANGNVRPSSDLLMSVTVQGT